MATYQFSPNAALDTGDELKFVTNELDRSLADLQAKVNTFLNANQSVSRDVYITAQQQWDRGQNAMELAMAKGIAALNDIHREYVLADSRGAQAFGSNL
jgi:uncharacterized protein YukE